MTNAHRHSLTKILCMTVLVQAFMISIALGQASVRSLQELQARSGLPNFYAKLQRGDSVKIVYFGGSITAAGGGWRDQSAAWIQQEFPQAKVSQVNAAIGGTGSDLGVFRQRNDVLAHRPDLVFVEFAVNDHGTAPERILKTMEGIVRQIWRANSQTDICFVYTLTATSAPTLAEGKLTNAMIAMEKVAEHYGIPSVQLGLEITDLYKKGDLLFKGDPKEHPGKTVFSNDNVHPYTETGHRLYAQALARSLSLLKSVSGKKKHKLIKPLAKDNWENARMILASELARSGDWQLLTETDPIARQFRNRLPILLKSNSAGATLNLSFKGSVAGFYDVVGPGCGQFEVTIDNGAEVAYPRFDRYSTYYRTHYFFLPELKPGPHTVTFKVSAKPLDKMAILKTGNNQPGELNRYETNDCYAGYVLLLGQ
jgi:lysophospholipase L1-like esterase